MLRKVFAFCICLLKYLYSKYEFLPVLDEYYGLAKMFQNLSKCTTRVTTIIPPSFTCLLSFGGLSFKRLQCVNVWLESLLRRINARLNSFLVLKTSGKVLVRSRLFETFFG